MDLREIKTKRPWGRMIPDPTQMHRAVADNTVLGAESEKRPAQMLYTQADMLCQYFPSSHLINSPSYYPDIQREEVLQVVDENGYPVMDDNGNPKTTTKKYTEHVPRYAFAFQQIIANKQIVHLTGNDIQFDFSQPNQTKENDDVLRAFRMGWLEKGMEIAFFDAVSSVKKTADGAVVGYIKGGKFGWKSLSYAKGDTLYPHFDSLTGDLILFARAFSDYDEDATKVTDWVEVWDDQYLYRYKHDLQAEENEPSIVSAIKNMFGLSGFRLVEKKRHGFNFVPVAYQRSEEGPAWAMAQDSIDGYELAYSQMAHNNQAFGEPILYLQGDGVEPVHDLNGTIKVLTMGTEDKAGYLEGQSAADSYQKQLDINYKMILKQSFCVETPQISGNSDISSAALKVLYADAIEKATIDASEYQHFLDTLVRIYAYGYGMEIEKNTEFINLPVMPWIKPYVHVNESSIINDLVQATGSGFISKQTASERASFYGETDEWERIIREGKEEQQADLLYQLKAAKQAQTQQTSTEDE